MEMENMFGTMAQCMMDNGKIISLMDKGYILGLMGKNMKARGKIMLCMEKGRRNGKMVGCTKASTRTALKKDSEH